MRLRRLELQGFKSFLDRTILTFEPGVTGVVGPNGCGKSNIVDAIMWVMGEQSPKHLRGESMTDIIFNGSDSRAPTSMAEVSLIMDRQGVALSPQFAAFDKSEEISVTRRIYRDGTGEFLINKVACRLKDIHELFMDTGVGRRAYSIIEQGQIDRMINVKPEDRRFLFEEVAGITKYKQKRKEAERKLELTRQNVLRLQDIIAELEKQIRSLKIQATKARKFKEIKTELELVDLYLLGRSLHTHQSLLTELTAKRDEVLASRSESDALFSQVDASVTELDVLRIDQEKEYQELGARERETSLKLQKYESKLGILEERKKFLSHSNESIVKEEEELGQREEGLVKQSEQEAQERDDVEHNLRALDVEISEKDQELRGMQESKQRLTQKRSSFESKRNQIAQREMSLTTQRENGEDRRHEIETARTNIEQKLSEIEEILGEHRASLQAVDERIVSCGERSRLAEEQATSLHSEVQQISARLSELEELLFKAREAYHSKHSRLESLTELQQNLEGYSPTAREILHRIEDQAITAVPLAEVLQPPPELEDHLEMLLGADMNTLLVNTTEEADKLARLVDTQELERVRIAALSEAQSAVAATIPDGKGAVPLLNTLKVKAGYEAAARKWLGNVFVCSDPASVLTLRTEFPQATFFSAGTRIIAHGDGSITSGTPQSSMGVFARRREIEELTVLCNELQAKLDALTTEREQSMHHLETQEKLHAELKDKLSSLHIESVTARKEREKVQMELSRAERDQSSLQDDLERNSGQWDSLNSQMEAWGQELSELIAEREELASEFEGLEAEIQALGDNFEGMVASINERKIERSKLGERVNSVRYKLERIASEITSLKQRRDTIRAQRIEDEKELIRIDDEGKSIQVESGSLLEERNATLVRISDVKAAFDETCQKLQELRRQKDELQDRRESVLEEIQQLELKMADLRAQVDRVKNLSIERYHKEPEALTPEAKLEIEKLPLLASQLDVTWELQMPHEQETLLAEHLKNLKEKVDRYGEVNLTAIQEFDEIQKRYDFLMGQKTDLENSIRILEEAILKIDESTKTRFEETFDAVDKKFREIFPILFNGGKAELTLTNPDNLLESGVDVMVQPPGKRLQSITLLSGGEKALTAVSLILAIFARKPSPFCLLDEVDAPLDDANVSRFNTVIRKMSEKTQFIVITHNKKTMEIAEALYGVTMERAGVSKMTSVRLN